MLLALRQRMAAADCVKCNIFTLATSLEEWFSVWLHAEVNRRFGNLPSLKLNRFAKNTPTIVRFNRDQRGNKERGVAYETLVFHIPPGIDPFRATFLPHWTG